MKNIEFEAYKAKIESAQLIAPTEQVKLILADWDLMKDFSRWWDHKTTEEIITDILVDIKKELAAA